MRRWFLFAALAGCYRPANAADCSVACTSDCPDGLACNAEGLCTADPATSCRGEPGGDARGPTNDGDPSICYGHANHVGQLCFASAPSASVSLTASFDTSACTGHQLMSLAGVEVCVVAGDQVSLDSLTVSGSRPLVIVAASEITIAGALTVTAGANAGCASAAGTRVGNYGGGGAGGTFNGIGGSGGGAPGGAGTISRGSESRPSVLHGGCAGGAGASSDGSAGAAGGSGGGAIALITAGVIHVDGSIVTPGTGGRGGTVDGGGGGGGSGGMIALDGPQLEIAGSLISEGGGGGGSGSKTAMGGSGAPGADGKTAARGGLTPSGVAGGSGSGPGSSLDGKPGTAGTTTAAGGGGGGAGWILSWGVSTQVASSAPPVTMLPP